MSGVDSLSEESEFRECGDAGGSVVWLDGELDVDEEIEDIDMDGEFDSSDVREDMITKNLMV